jgi:hypothetical protein
MGERRACLRCRLLQAADRCESCGEATYGPNDRASPLLYDPQALNVETKQALGYVRGLGATVWIVAGFVLGTILCERFVPLPYATIAILAGTALMMVSLSVFGLVRRPTARRLVRAMPMPALVGGTRIFGRVRAVDAAMSEDGHVLRCVWAGDDQEVLVRELRKVDFMVDGEDGKQVMVAGDVYVTGGERVDAAVLGEWAPSLAGDTARLVLVRQGDRVCVQGEAREEQIADGYRDTKVLVLRGTPERPVIAYSAPLR